MKITPAPGPTPPAHSEPMQDGKARALAKLNAAMQANANPVPNPTQISPEEVGAITSKVSQPGEQISQNDTSESSQAPAVTKAPEEPLSSQYAQLARREKALRAEAIKLKQQKADAARAESELQAKAAQMESELRAKIEAEYRENFIPKSRITEDTLGVINEAGISYDDLTNRILNPPTPLDATTRATLQALKDEIKGLKAEQEKSKKSYEENQTNAYKQAVESIRRDVSQLVKTNPDFETVQATGSVNDVVELIERTFNEGLSDEYPKGTVLDVEVAARMVEDHLVDEALKVARLKKIQSKLQPAAPATKPAAAPAQQPQKTLSNTMGSNRPLTVRERALLAFEGKLNK